MIELRQISKNFGKNVIYQNFDLKIDDGKILSVLGPSGCGKTTLLNILAGITDFKGSISPKLSCSYIFQQPRLIPNLTVEGNLKLICSDLERIHDMLARVGLQDKLRTYPVELSGGQAQRVSIARAFLHRSDLILMDEPFSSLDTVLKIRLMQLFGSIWEKERRTAVFVTHDVEEAYMLSHRAIVLQGGTVRADVFADGQSSVIPREYGAASQFRQRILDVLLEKRAE